MKTKRELLEELFPDVAKALSAIVFAGSPDFAGVCHYCMEDYDHQADCPYEMAELAWDELEESVDE